jgi:hypothetical protein
LLVPDVSVLMPVLNGAAFLRPAIESVLAQSCQNFELIVVDDGSTDGSPELAESFGDSRIVVIRNEHRGGLPVALNVGLKRASGEFVARLDADDRARADRLERQLETLRGEPGLVLLGSQGRVIDESDAVIGTVERCCSEASIHWYCLLDNPFIHSSVMFRRREILDELGGYDESLRVCEDWALWARVMQRYGVRNLPDLLIDYRSWSSSLSGALESSASHPRRPMLHDVVGRLIARHVTDTFGAGAASPADVEIMTGFMLGVRVDTLEVFLALFDRWLTLFDERFPDARTSADFQRMLARQYDAIAYRLTPPQRWAALRVYKAAIARGPQVARQLSWSRMGALTVFGRTGRERLRQIRNATMAKPL